jgi:hypothetical protein
LVERLGKANAVPNRKKPLATRKTTCFEQSFTHLTLHAPRGDPSRFSDPPRCVVTFTEYRGEPEFPGRHQRARRAIGRSAASSTSLGTSVAV